MENLQRKKEEKKVEETLVKVGLLESDYEKYPEELSGGQQQRVVLQEQLSCLQN